MINHIDRILRPEIVSRKPRRMDISSPLLKSFRGNSAKLIGFSPENEFQTFLHFEKRRSERSRKCFVLFLLEVSPSLQANCIDSLMTALQDSMRETDIAGWYKTGTVIGVVFTEVDPMNSAAISEVLLNKTVGALSLRFPKEVMSNLLARVTAFPENLQDKWRVGLRTAVG